MHPHIAIAILNFNGKKYLEQYLPFVINTTYPNKSIWVIDNQSTDDSIAFLKTYYPDVQIIVNEENVGFAAGYNAGLLHIKADYYLLLNSDIEATPGFIEPVLEMMESDTSIAFAQPKILSLKNRTLFEYAGAGGGMMDTLGYPFCRGRILDHVETDKGQYDDNAAIFWASGACLFARATIYNDVLKGMYTFYYMHNEEIDLCWRAQNLGYKIFVCGASQVYHLGGGSLEWTNPNKILLTFRNNLIMNTRNMPVGRLLWLIPLRMFLDIAAALQYCMLGKRQAGWAVIRAVIAYWKWLFFGSKKDGKDKKWSKKRGIQKCTGVFKGSIIWNYFIAKKRTYKEIIS